MIKEITKEVTFTEKHRYCDECGKEIKRTMACSHAECKYCGKDLCDKCVSYEENTMGDYRVVYCKTCWELGNDYRLIIEQHEKEIDRLYNKWQNKCKLLYESKKK